MMLTAKNKILSIEAIRGMAAIYVMLGHIVLLYKPYSLIPRFEFIIKTIFGFGQQAVLLFFIVSGFSITYSAPDFNAPNNINISEYFYKRFRRIYPLFFISLVISIVILIITESRFEPFRTLLSFFFLTDKAEGSISYPISTNFPIWSLSYEVVYYILFPLIYILVPRIGKKKSFILLLTLSIISGVLNILFKPNHIFNVFQYSWVWLAGSFLAKAYKNKTYLKFNNLKGITIFSVAFMITFEQIPLIKNWFWSLFFILVFLSFLIDDKRDNIKKVIINFFIGFFSILACYCFTYIGNITYHTIIIRIFLFSLLIINLIINLLSSSFQKGLLRLFIKPFVKTGSISYALYIIHWPLIILFIFYYKKFFYTNITSLLFIIILNVIVVFIVSYFLEKQLQPKIEKKLNHYYSRSSILNNRK